MPHNLKIPPKTTITNNIQVTKYKPTNAPK